MIRALDISGSALAAQRTRLDVIAGTSQCRRDAPGGRYAHPVPGRVVTFATTDGQGGPGVHVDAIAQDPSPFREKYDPGHKDADERGYVHLPNVSVTMGVR